MKKSLAFALAALVVILIMSISSGDDSARIQSDDKITITESPDEKALLARGLEIARIHGLVGEPTEIRTLLLPISEWRGMMLSSTAFENPSVQVFILSVKGKIQGGLGEGFGHSIPGIEPVPTALPPDGLTIAFTTSTIPNTGTMQVSQGFIDDLAAETTEEDRQTFKALQEMDIMSILQEGGSPPVDLSIYNTPEATLEPVPVN